MNRLDRAMAWVILATFTLFMTWPGFQQGLGYIPEEVRRVAIAIQIAHTGDLNPHWFGHPATLLIYGLSGIYKAVSLSSSMGALNGTWADLRNLYLTEPEGLFLIGRALARLAAVAAVIATLEVGIRIMPKRWAIVAAILTAANPVFITNANRLRCDHILTFFLLLGTILLSETTTNQDTCRNQSRTSILAGIAITYKYLAGCILVAQIAVIASLDTSPRQKLRSIGSAIGLACAASFVASPFLWLDLPQVLRDVLWEATRKKFAWNPMLSLEMMATVIRYGFSDAGYLILLCAALFGIWKLSQNGKAQILSTVQQAGKQPYYALVLILLVYIGSTLLSTVWNATWMAPLVPLLSLVLVRETLRARTALPRLLGHNSRAGLISALTLASVIFCIVLGSQLKEDASIHSIRTSETVMNRAERWVEKEIPANSRILLVQPEPDQDGFFPRIRVRGATLLGIDEKGNLQTVCLGERVDRYESQKRLPEEKCFPRPRVRSQSPDGRSLDLVDVDFIITSSRRAPEKTVTDANGKPIKLISVFSKPATRHRLSYPRDANFPQGDYGMWRHIRIYSVGSHI